MTSTTAARGGLGHVATPSEKIVDREPMIAMHNAEKFLREGKFVVKLACGHLIYTRNRESAVCLRCSEMLRRSIYCSGGEMEDWESFRRGVTRDTMRWKDDPCRVFNEPRWEDGE